MALSKAVYDHVAKYPGRTSNEITVAMTGYITSHHYRIASIHAILSTLKCTGMLQNVLPVGKLRGGQYFVASFYDKKAYSQYNHKKAVEARAAAKFSHRATQADLFAKQEPTITRDKLREITQKHFQGGRFPVPVHHVAQICYDTCIAAGVRVTGS
jgi:hypothetical protein